MIKTSAQPYKHIQQTACHARQQWHGPHTVTQDSNNNQVLHREGDRLLETDGAKSC